jgi:Breast carcinoma amplified sequence 2 (BCAS2)
LSSAHLQLSRSDARGGKRFHGKHSSTLAPAGPKPGHRAARARLQDSAVLRGEMARIRKGQKRMPPHDMTMTNLETPRLHDQDNLAAWQAAAGNAGAQLEHQFNRCACYACLHWLSCMCGPTSAVQSCC